MPPRTAHKSEQAPDPAGSHQGAFNPSIPLYHQIYLQLRDEITDGLWSGSKAFYGEEELARKYRVSSITSRRAMEELAAEGLIQRSRGRRARVIYQPSEKSSQAPSVIYPVGRLKSFTYKIISTGVEVAAAEACAVFGLPAGSRLWTCRRLRTVAARSHSISFHAQPEEVGLKHDLKRLERLPMWQALSHVGIRITSTSRTIEARFPPPFVASHLGIDTHEPMLVYTYILMDSEGVKRSWLRIFIHPGERTPTEYIDYQTGAWSNDPR